MIKELLLVAAGGGVGSALRYLASVGISKCFSFLFPLGTFIVNITGCLVIGLLMGLSVRFNILDDALKLLLIVGFCGGYTTFSTFSLEGIKLFEAGNYGILALYIAGSVIFGILAVWCGNALAKLILN